MARRSSSIRSHFTAARTSLRSLQKLVDRVAKTAWRDRVVPAGPHPRKAARSARCRNAPDEEADLSGPAGSSRPLRRYPWVDLLRRVFALDVLECPDCGGRMRILSAIHPPEATRAILQCLGLPSRAPPIAPARPDPEFAEPAPSDR